MGSLRTSADRPRVLAAVTWAYLVWSLAPVLYAVRVAFSATDLSPPEGFSLQPFRFALRDDDFVAALGQSAKLALITVVIAVPLGTALALALRHLRGRSWRWLQAGMLAAIAMPSIVFAMILLYLFAFVVKIGLSTQAQVIAHATLALPFVVLVVFLRVTTLEDHVEEQAFDLGAPPNQVVTRVLLPMLAPAIAVGAAVAFSISFNDLVLSRNLCFPNECRTVPMFLYGGRGVGDPPPDRFALAVLSVLISSTLLLIGAFALGRRRAR